MRPLAPIRSILSPTTCAGHGDGMLSVLVRRHQLLSVSRCFVSSGQSRAVHTIGTICSRSGARYVYDACRECYYGWLTSSRGGWRYNHTRHSLIQSRVFALSQKRRNGNTNLPEDKWEVLNRHENITLLTPSSDLDQRQNQKTRSQNQSLNYSLAYPCQCMKTSTQFLIF